jgi:RNA-directed DNA polymerase
MYPHRRQLRRRHGVCARAAFNLVAPLAAYPSAAATAMRTTDTAGQLDLFAPPGAASGAVVPLIGLERQEGLRWDDVDSANDLFSSTPSTPSTPGCRTSTTATRTTTTRATSTGLARSADRSGADLSFSDMLAGWLDCRRTKRNTATARAFEDRVEDNLVELLEELLAGTYRPGPSICFAIRRPKRREVWAAGFRDRVVHHILHRRIAARFERTFIADSCACIEGRGTLYAARRLEAKVRSLSGNWSRRVYYLKCDVANFFPSIDKNRLGRLLAAGIREPFWRALALRILHHDPRPGAELRGDPTILAAIPSAKSLFGRPAHLGLPIGNLPSQFGANVYLNELDQFVKHRLRAPHYVRYVDDFVLLDESPARLNAWRAAIESFLPERLGLQLNPVKTILQPVERGVDFVGHLLKPHRRILRRRTLRDALTRLAGMPEAEVPAAANSYLGLARQATHSYHDRAALANVIRHRGFAVDHHLTKVYA